MSFTHTHTHEYIQFILGANVKQTVKNALKINNTNKLSFKL